MTFFNLVDFQEKAFGPLIFSCGILMERDGVTTMQQWVKIAPACGQKSLFLPHRYWDGIFWTRWYLILEVVA